MRHAVRFPTHNRAVQLISRAFVPPRIVLPLELRNTPVAAFDRHSTRIACLVYPDYFQLGSALRRPAINLFTNMREADSLHQNLSLLQAQDTPLSRRIEALTSLKERFDALLASQFSLNHLNVIVPALCEVTERILGSVVL